MRPFTRGQAALELLIWALFLGGSAVATPAVNWLGIRGAIVWIQRELETP
jgi:hypothetical protein